MATPPKGWLETVLRGLTHIVSRRKTFGHLSEDPVAMNGRDVKVAAHSERHRASQFETLLAQAPLGVYLVDADFKIREVNPTALPVFGDIPDLIGRDFGDVVRVLWPEEYARYIVDRFRHTLETGVPFVHKEHVERRKDRAVRECYEWQINRVNLPDGRHGVVCYFRDISADVLAREAIAESEARFRMLAENVSQLFWGCDADGQCDLLSRQWVEYTGIPEHEQLGLRWLDLVIHPDDRERTLNTWMQAVSDQATYDLEFRIRGADGIYRWYKTRGTPIRDVCGAIVRWFGTCTEIDAQMRTEHALRVARDRFQTVLQHAPIVLFTQDSELRTTWVLNSFEGSESIIGKTDLEVAAMGGVISVEDATETTEFKARVLATGVGERREQTFSVVGELKTYDTTIEPIRDASGQVVGLAGVSLDISERKQAEKERERLEGQRQLALDAARLGWWHFDPASQVASYDDRYREIFGVTENTCSNEEILALIHPDDLPRVWAAFQAALDPANPTPYATEFRLNRRDGALCWVEAHGLAVFEGEGSRRRPRGFSGTVADITARKEGEEALRLESIKTRRLADSNIIGVLFANPERIIDANDAFLEMVGYTKNDLAAGLLRWREMTPVEHSNIDNNAVDELERLGVATPWQKEFFRKDGSRVPVMIGAAVFDLAPTWVAFVQDMSRIKEVENELRKTDRRKDEFLAMLAHELRNPLAAISGAVSVASSGELSGHAAWSMDVIKRQMNHLRRLIDDLLDVSRINQGKIELRRAVLDLTPVLDSAVATVEPLACERKHRFDVFIERDALWVNADPTRLEQVVVNLLNNAVKYSEDQGHIWLRAHYEGDFVAITVGDKGIGIPPEQLPYIFQLFAQGDRALARSEGGLGIGLTVVERLVGMHGGNVTASSEGSGKGSEFTIRLPAAQRPTVPGESKKTATPAASKKSRILIVDDNVDTARSMAMLLSIIGHDVVTAYNGPEALEVARVHRPAFVLLDIGLPGMDGYEVASKLRQEECCHTAVVVAVSGYGQDEDRRRSKEAGFDHHLIKPLDHEVLLTLISAESERAQTR